MARLVKNTPSEDKELFPESVVMRSKLTVGASDEPVREQASARAPDDRTSGLAA
jgi:hypothetical protein